LTFHARSKDLERVGDIRVSHLAHQTLQTIGKTNIECFHTRAMPANDVVVMVLACVELVTVGAVPKVAPPHKVAFFHDTDGTVNSHRIAQAFGQAPVQFVGAERAVFLNQHIQESAARSRNPMARLLQR
jgi:hypothetical protein